MRLSLIVCVLFLIFSVCYAQETIDPNLWDFGKIKAGEVAKHEFLLKNNSDKVLNIKEVHTAVARHLR